VGFYWIENQLVELVGAGGAVATAVIIWWQARLLRQQNQLNALLSLQQEWESDRVRKRRSKWAESLNDQPDALLALEPVLEFLEEFAGYWLRRVLDNELIWDSTIGWHAARYYFYSHADGSIDQLRAKWGGDQTLYQNLEKLWKSYVKVELKKRRGLNKAALEKEIRDSKPAFLEAEKYDASDGSKSSD
jgi:hypothetical protein